MASGADFRVVCLEGLIVFQAKASWIVIIICACFLRRLCERVDKCSKKLTAPSIPTCLFLQRHSIINRFKAERKKVPTKYERDISAENFLKVLSEPLRKITLHLHLALIYHHYEAEHPLCQHALMEAGSEHSEVWKTFVKSVVDAEARGEATPEDAGRPAIPMEKVRLCEACMQVVAWQIAQTEQKMHVQVLGLVSTMEWHVS